MEERFWPAENELRRLALACDIKMFVFNDCNRGDYHKLKKEKIQKAAASKE